MYNVRQMIDLSYLPEPLTLTKQTLRRVVRPAGAERYTVGKCAKGVAEMDQDILSVVYKS